MSTTTEPLAGGAVPPGSDAVAYGPTLGLSLSDHVLVDRLRGRDAVAEASLATLYDRYANAVYQVGRRLLHDDGDAEELLQETFWRLWSHSSRYVPERGRFSTWLLRVATNLAIDTQRHAARRRWPAALDQDGPAAAEPQDTSPSLPDQVCLAELREILATGLSGLPFAQRQALELVYVSGFTHTESAVMLGAPCSTLKTRLTLGLRKLAVHLGAHGVTRADARS